MPYFDDLVGSGLANLASSYMDDLDPISRKLADLTTSTESKIAMLADSSLRKNLDLTGFKEHQTLSYDGDSGEYIDDNGNKREFRFADLNRIDTFDTLKANQNSPYKNNRQPQQIANLLGKRIDELTPEDYDQADKYHAYAVNKFMQTGEVEPYIPGIDYRNYKPEPVNLYLKKIGEDRYGRDLVEAYNPDTGKNVSFDLSNNPDLNSEFNLQNSLDTEKNRQRLEQYNKDYQNYLDTVEYQKKFGISPKSNNDLNVDEYRKQFRENRIGEDIDLAQSNAYQSFARVVDLLPDGFKDVLNIDNEKWAKIASPEGQAIADAWAGVDPSTREEYQAAMQESVNQVNEALNGKDIIPNFAKATWGVIKNLDRFLSDSAVQTTLGVAGTLLGGAGLGAVGIGGVAKGIGGSLIGGMASGLDETLTNMQEYKAKHGKDMDPADAWKMYLQSIPIAAAEGLLAMSGLKRLGDWIRKPVKEKFSKTGLANFAKDSIKAAGKSTAFEGVQEYAQNVHGMLYTDPDKSFAEVLKDPENVFSGIAGAAMGGGMSVANSTLGGIISIPKFKKDQKKKTEIAKVNQERATKTELDEDADITASDEAFARIVDIIKSNPKTDDEIKAAYDEITAIGDNDDLSKLVRERAGQAANKLIEKYIGNSEGQDAIEKLKKFGMTPEEFHAENVVYNHPDSEFSINENEGREVTEEYRQEQIKKLSEMAHKLGLDDDTIHRNMDLVVSQIAHGPYSYRNYARNFSRNIAKANDETLDEAIRTKASERSQKWLNSIINLANNQVTKISQFNDAINRIASGTSNQEVINWESTYGKPFVMKGEEVALKPYEERYKANGVFSSLMSETRNIGKVLGKALKGIDLSNLDTSGLDSLREKYRNLTNQETSYITAANRLYATPTNTFGLNSDSIVKNGIEDSNLKKALNYVTNAKATATTRRNVLLGLYDLSDEAFSKIVADVNSEGVARHYKKKINDWKTYLGEIAKMRESKVIDGYRLNPNPVQPNLPAQVRNTSPAPTTPATPPATVQPANPPATRQPTPPAIQKGKDLAPVADIWYGSGDNKELSNLYERGFEFNGKKYRSIEHAYQTLKSGKFDEKTYNKYNSRKSVAGLKIKGKTANRKNNIQLMERLIRSSLAQNEDFRNALLATSGKLITHKRDSGIWSKELPRIMMKFRYELQKKKNKPQKPVQQTPASSSLTPEGTNELDWSVNVFREITKPFRRLRNGNINEHHSVSAKNFKHSVSELVGAIRNPEYRRAVRYVVDGISRNQEQWKQYANRLANFYNEHSDKKINFEYAWRVLTTKALLNVLNDEDFKKGEKFSDPAINRLVNSVFKELKGKEYSKQFVDSTIEEYFQRRSQDYPNSRRGERGASVKPEQTQAPQNKPTESPTGQESGKDDRLSTPDGNAPQNGNTGQKQGTPTQPEQSTSPALETPSETDSGKQFKKPEAPDAPTVEVAGQEATPPATVVAGSIQYINHSGGADGSDSVWDDIGKEYGVKTNHYYSGKKTPRGNTEISKEDFAEGKKKATTASRQMGRIKQSQSISSPLVIRDWAQVKYADAIFAIGTIDKAGTILSGNRKTLIDQVSGGTGNAVQMAINEGKPVYVFDISKGSWFTHDGKSFVKYDGIPRLTPNFAGIGTRGITKEGKDAIRQVYEATFGKSNPSSTITDDGFNPDESGEDTGMDEIPPEDFADNEEGLGATDEFQEDFNDDFSEDFNDELIPGDTDGLDMASDIDDDILAESYNDYLEEELNTGTFDENFDADLEASILADSIAEEEQVDNIGPSESFDETGTATMSDDVNEWFGGSKTTDKRSDKMPDTITIGIDDSDGFLSRENKILQEVRNSLNGVEYEIDEETETDSDSESVTSEYDKNAKNVPAFRSIFNKSRFKVSDRETFGTIIGNIFKSFASSAKRRNASDIARNGIDDSKLTQSIVNRYRKVLDKITPTTSNEISLHSSNGKSSKIDSYVNFLTKPKNGLNGHEVAYENPADFLIYDMTQNGDDVTFEINDTMVLATRMVTSDFLSTYNIRTMLKPESTDQMAAMFGIAEHDLRNNDDIIGLKYVMSKFGIPAPGISDGLGNRYMKFLGISESNDENRLHGMYERTVEGLGQFALNALIAEGILVKEVVTPDKISEILDNDKNLSGEVKAAIKQRFTKNLMMVRPANREGLRADVRSLVDVYLGKEDKKTGKRSGGYADHYHLNLSNVTSPVISDESPFKPSRFVGRSGGLIESPDSAIATIDKLQHQAYVPNWRLARFLFGNQLYGDKLNMLPYLFKKMGFKSEEEIYYMEKNQAESAVSVNRSLFHQIQMALVTLGEFARPENAGKKMYCKYKQSKNFRFNMYSNTINPQLDKQLGRSLFPIDMQESRINLNSKEYKEKKRIKEAFNITVNFDALQPSREYSLRMLDWLDSMSLKDILTMRFDYMTMNDGEYSAKYFKKSNEYLRSLPEFAKLTDEQKDKLGYKLGAETIGLALITFDHLIQKKQAKDGKFNTFLLTEIDSTTSGYYHRIAQIPSESVRKIAEPVGIISSDSKLYGKSISEIKAGKLRPDVYEQFAIDATDRLKYLSSIDQMKGDERKEAISSLFSKSKLSSGFLYKIFTAIKAALPVSDGKVVSKDLRTLIKSPAIPAGYNASAKSTARVTTDEIMSGVISKYMQVVKPVLKTKDKSVFKSRDDVFNAFLNENPGLSESEIQKYRAVYDTVEQFNSVGPAFIASNLRKKGIDRIIVPVTNKEGKKTKRSLEYVLREAINHTYGDAVASSIENTFSDIRKYNNAINAAFNTVSTILKRKFEEGLKKLYDENGLLTTEKQFREMLSSLDKFMPKVLSPMGGYANMVRTKKATGSDNPFNQVRFLDVNKDGVQNFNVAYGRGYTIDMPKQAPAVGMIHMLDGCGVQHIVLTFGGVNPIHDAIVVSFDEIDITGKNYNGETFYLNQDYNMVENVLKMYKRIYGILSAEERDTVIVDHLGNKMESFTKAQIPEDKVEDFKNDVKELEDSGKVLTASRLSELETKYNALSDKTVDDVEVKIGETWDSYMPYFESLVAENNLNRDEFFSHDYKITNITGDEDSIVDANSRTSATSNEFAEKIRQHKNLYNSAQGFKTTGQQFQMLKNGLESPEARVEILNSLDGVSHDLGIQTDSDEHLNRLRDLLKSFDCEKLRKVSVFFSKKGKSIQGKYDSGSKKIHLGAYDPKAKNIHKNARACMTLTSTYAHEVTHAATLAVIDNPHFFKANDKVRELNKLYDLWLQDSDWTDFMPENYDPKMKNIYELYAKTAYDYIKNNKDNNNLAEFLAYATTFEPFVNKLKNKVVFMNGENLSLSERLFNILKAFLKLVSGNGSFEEMYDSIASLKTGMKINPSVNLYETATRLATEISAANNKAINKINQHPLKLAEHMYDVLASQVRKLNTDISTFLENTFSNPKNAKYKWNVKVDDSKLDIIAKIFPIALRASFDSNARKAFNLWCQNVGGLLQTGTIMTILREVSPTDTRTGILQNLATRTRLVEKAAKGMEASIAKQINAAFDNELNDAQREVLCKGVIHTDMQSLVSKGYSASDIMSMVNNEKKLLGEIDKVKERIAGKHSDKANELLNKCKSLALYMMERKGNEATNINTDMIAYEAGIENKTTTSDLDTLKSLYALSLLTDDQKEVLNTLKRSGLSHFINAHKEWANSIKNGGKIRLTVTDKENTKDLSAQDSYKIVSGYSKQLFDNNTAYKIDLVSNYSENRKDGYVLVKTHNPGNGLPELGIYMKSYANFSSRDGTAFMLRGENMFVESISTSTFRMAQDNDPNYTSLIASNARYNYKNMLNRRRTEIMKKMAKNELTFDELRKMSSGFIPMYSPSAKYGGYIIFDYQFSPDNDIREGVINNNYDGVDILSKMYSSQITNAYSGFLNDILLDYLIGDMKDHMRPDHTDDETGKKYVKIDDKSLQKFMDKANIMLPKSVKNFIGKNNLYIREDWILNLFGNESLSLSDWGPIRKYMPAIFRTGIRMAEYAMKTIATFVKTNILFKVPYVFIGNIWSNMLYSIMTGSNPLKVMKYTVKNFIAVKQYMIDNQKLDELLMKQRLKTATQLELARIPVYQKKLSSNIVAPLIKFGMLQNVIEDINSQDVGNLKRFQKKLSNSFVGKVTPDIVKKGISMMYLGDETLPYRFVSNLTQISDFAARATEYQLRMERAPEKTIRTKDPNGKMVERDNPKFIEYHDALIRELWDAFVNYDTPQSSVMQYLNDMGITMFTKYAFRIQKIIRQQLWKNPIGALLFLFTNAFIMDINSIMEQNVLQKSWSSLIHNPFTNIYEALVPVPVQYATGTGLGD